MLQIPAIPQKFCPDKKSQTWSHPKVPTRCRRRRMSFSRRQLLRHTIFAVAAWTARPLHGQGWAAPKPVHGNSLENVPGPNADRTRFTGLIGSGFRVTPTSRKGATVWLRLLAVEDLPTLEPVNVGSMAVPPKQTSAQIYTHGFMLSFLGTMPETLLQGTYIFEHPNMAKFSLLIVPGGHGSQTYTAVINRL